MRISQKDIIYNVLRKYGQMNGHQVAGLCNLNPHEVMKRFSDLERERRAAVVVVNGTELRAPTPKKTAKVYRAL